MTTEEIMYTLLSTGIYTNVIHNLHEINTHLRNIHFEVIEWYDKSCYILRNLSSENVLVGYNENENIEILKVIEKIVRREPVESNLLPSLVTNGWIESDGDIVLSKKALVLLKDVILDMNGRYKICKICEFLVDDNTIHEYCEKTEKACIEIDTPIERKENVVSFCLEYKMVLNIDRSKCMSVVKYEDGYIYVFEFENINDAILFENKPVCSVLSATVSCDETVYEKEIVGFAQAYMKQGGDKKRYRKKLVEDENGFMRYV